MSFILFRQELNRSLVDYPSTYRGAVDNLVDVYVRTIVSRSVDGSFVDRVLNFNATSMRNYLYNEAQITLNTTSAINPSQSWGNALIIGWTGVQFNPVVPFVGFQLKLTSLVNFAGSLFVHRNDPVESTSAYADRLEQVVRQHYATITGIATLVNALGVVVPVPFQPILV